MSEIRKINVIENTNGDHVELVEGIRERMAAAGFEIVEDENPDLLVAVGGDGTFLYHIRERGYPETPIVGVNAGTLGFLLEVEIDEVDQLINELKNEEYEIVREALLRVKNVDSDTELYAFNELTIAGPGPSAANLKIEIDGAQFAKFSGDGLIIATTQGSSAYNTSSGGPIVAPGLDAMVVTPSNTFMAGSYDSITSPIVLSADSEVVVQNMDTGRRPVEFYIDGKDYTGIVLDPDLPISITKAARSVQILRTSKYHFYKRLARKTIRRI